MNLLKIAILLLPPVAAHADVEWEVCGKLGGKMHQNPASLSMGELVTLRDCAAEMMRARQSQMQNEKEIKAFQRLNSKDGE